MVKDVILEHFEVSFRHFKIHLLRIVGLGLYHIFFIGDSGDPSPPPSILGPSSLNHQDLKFYHQEKNFSRHNLQHCQHLVRSKLPVSQFPKDQKT